MFRSILCDGRKAFASANLKLNYYYYYCSKPRKFPEINQVTLVGTLISDAHTLQSGTQSLTVKTFDASRGNFEVHNIFTRGFDDLKAGERVHVIGSLASTPFQTEEGKTRKQILVRATRTFVLDDQNESENTATKDINRVDIVANVCTGVTRMKNDTVVFQVATHFERNTQDGMAKGSNFLTVQVFDEDLKNFAESLKPNDKVSIEGKIARIPYIFPDGKKKYTGFIVAKSIEKTKRRKQQVDHDDVEHEANYS